MAKQPRPTHVAPTLRRCLWRPGTAAQATGARKGSRKYSLPCCFAVASRGLFSSRLQT